ncbi:hypothetical protein ACFWP7_17755 [Streptomyces sp. NPDC058470]|uniref:hypothetical protein n=1 Tax=Streptomyces sp. NPDC058470 TaxID=3346515 RepID=UPI00364DF33F
MRNYSLQLGRALRTGCFRREPGVARVTRTPGNSSFPGPDSCGVTSRKFIPPPALCGFVLLLALLFSVSYAAGSAAGPVAPAMHGTGTGTGTKDGGGGDGDMSEDMGDMYGGGTP